MILLSAIPPQVAELLDVDPELLFQGGCQVIARIDAGLILSLLSTPATVNDLGVMRPAGRAPYLRTYADGDWNDNLLSLNQCPL
jgi:hypothetical protein